MGARRCLDTIAPFYSLVVRGGLVCVLNTSRDARNEASWGMFITLDCKAEQSISFSRHEHKTSVVFSLHLMKNPIFNPTYLWYY